LSYKVISRIVDKLAAPYLTVKKRALEKLQHRQMFCETARYPGRTCSNALSIAAQSRNFLGIGSFPLNVSLSQYDYVAFFEGTTVPDNA